MGDDQGNDHSAGSDLSPNAADHTAAAVRSLLGVAPFVGPLLSEVCTAIIPNQRQDRIAKFCLELERRINELDPDHVKERLRDPRVVELLETSFVLAVRSLSEERIRQIASVMAEGITQEELDFERLRTVLDLLGELSDLEVLKLSSYTRKRQNDAEWFERHRDVLHGPQIHWGSSQEDIDRWAIHRQIAERLVRLGLLQPRFKNPQNGELPEFDEETGKMKSSGYEITRLGEIVLTSAGVDDD